MTNILSGLRSFRHWNHLDRSARRASPPVDRAATRRDLIARRADTDALLAQVQRDGVAALPGYWTEQQCAAARAEIDRLILEHPAQVQLYSNGADKRMFGAESTSALLMEFHADPFLRKIGEFLSGLGIYNFATLGARIEATPDNIGSGAGWHRDAHGFQFKSIIYLSDTTIENGPFEYLVGSHTVLRATLDATTGGIADPLSTRLTDTDIDRLTARGVERRSFPAPAGTLLLVNTAGIHRGMPLISGSRYALTNYYYYPHEVDEERIAKFSPLMPGAAERIRRDRALAG